MNPPRKPASGTFLLVQDGEPIGETTIRRADWAMVSVGTFKPYPAYERLRPFFRRYFEASNRVTELYGERDTLSLTLSTRDGRIIPVDWIEIGDASLKLPEEDAYQASLPPPPGFFDDPSLWVEDEA